MAVTAEREARDGGLRITSWIRRRSSGSDCERGFRRRAGWHAFSNPYAEPARILAMSAGSYPDVVAYPEDNYAWVATRVPELPAGGDPGIIARFDFQMSRPDDRVS